MRRGVLLSGAAAILAGCVGVADVNRAAPQRIALPESGVVVAGPPGFCIDRSATRVGAGGGAFVLLGSCASIARSGRAPKPSVPAILTVSVSEGETTDALVTGMLSDLATYFRTSEGLATLSRTGDPNTVQLIDTRIAGDVLYLHARDSHGAEKGMSPEYWRALMAVNDRLVSLSVVGFETAPLPGDGGLSTIDAFADRIRAETARATEPAS